MHGESRRSTFDDRCALLLYFAVVLVVGNVLFPLDLGMLIAVRHYLGKKDSSDPAAIVAKRFICARH